MNPKAVLTGGSRLRMLGDMVTDAKSLYDHLQKTGVGTERTTNHDRSDGGKRVGGIIPW